MEWKFSHTWVCAYLVNNALNLIDVLALDRYFLKEKKVVGPLTGSDLKLTVKICFTDRLCDPASERWLHYIKSTLPQLASPLLI